MTLKAGVDVIGNTAPLMAALGDASKATVDYEGTTVDAFANMDRSALAYAASLDRLALATAKYGVGSLGAAEATLRHQRVVTNLQSAHTSAMSTVGRNLTTYATIPIVAGMAVAVKSATDFQSQMLQIQTQAGASASEVNAMSKAVLSFAQSGAQQGPTQLAQGLFHLESVGLRGASAMNALKVASNAAALGMAPLEDTASALAGAITSGIKGTGDYQQAMGTLNATIGAGNMHMDDLLGALSTGLLPKAKNAGLSLNEVGAALAVLTDRGMSAEQAATRLGQTLAFMEKQTPSATKALADMGISSAQVKETIGGPNGLYNVLQMLAQGMQNVGAQQGRADILTAFGGGRSSGALLTLIQSLTSATSSYQGKLQQIAATSGNLTADEAAQQKTAAAQFHQDIAKMEADAVDLGNSLLPLATGVVNTVAKIAGAFNSLPQPVKQDIEVIAGLLAIGGPMLLAVSTAQRMVTALGTVFETMGLKARVGVGEADAQLATMGTTLSTVEGEATGLRAALLGLGAADVLAALTAFVGILSIPGSSGATVPGYPSKQSYPLLNALSHSTGGFKGDPAGLKEMEYKWLNKKGVSAAQMEAFLVNNLQTLVNAGVFPQSVLSEFALAPAFPGLKPPPGYVAPGSKTGAKSNTGPSPLAPPGFVPPVHRTLTPAQVLQLELDLNPTSPKLLREQATIDEHTLAWLRRRFHAGKIDSTQFVAEAGPLETAIAASRTKTTTAVNKQKTAETKAQREHAQTVAAHAQTLMDAVAKTVVGGPKGGGKGLSKDQVDAYDGLVAFYKAESHDAKLTADERARYAGLAIAARKQQIAESLKGASNYEKIAIEDAKGTVDLAKRIKGDRAGQERALRNEIRVYAAAAANPALAATKRATYRADEASAKEQLANLKGTYAPPMALQLALAKASATGNMGELYNTALAEKAAAERAIKSGTLGMQGMIDAWNVIDQANQTLLTDISGASVKQSAAGFLRGLNLHGLTRLQKIAIEQGFSQSMAHAGHVPTGAGVQGVATVHSGVVINGPIHLHGVADIDGIQQGLQRKGIYRAVQVRGPYAGHGAV